MAELPEEILELQRMASEEHAKIQAATKRLEALNFAMSTYTIHCFPENGEHGDS